MNRAKILEKLNLRLPLVASPMFIVSQLDLVLECCKNGIVGTFPALNNRTTAGFEDWLILIKENLRNHAEATGTKLPPYGVNLIVHRTNPRVQADLEVCVRQEVPIIITSLGAAKEVVEKIHSYGGLVFHDVTNTYHAKKAIDAGVDGLILVCAGAGGHAGTLHPIPFVAEIRAMFDGVILLAGGLSTGQDIATAMQMGADLAYMGTRFINTTEAIAKDEYKEMIINAGTQDIIYTASVSGIHANFLLKSLLASGFTKDMWDKKVKIDLGEELDTSSKAWVDLWSAGHGVATIKDTLPAGKLIERLGKEFREALRKQQTLLKLYCK